MFARSILAMWHSSYTYNLKSSSLFTGEVDSEVTANVRHWGQLGRHRQRRLWYVILHKKKMLVILALGALYTNIYFKDPNLVMVHSLCCVE